MEDEIAQFLSAMLQAAYEQGMAAQRVEDANKVFNEKAEIVMDNHARLREFLNLDKPEEKKAN